MSSNIEKNRRLFGLFLLACLLFNYPILSLFDLPRLFIGIPLLYIYIFAVWLVVIGITARISNRPENLEKRSRISEIGVQYNDGKTRENQINPFGPDI